LLSSGLKLHQIKDYQDEGWLYVQERKCYNLNKSLLDVLFFLAAEGATRDGAFLLSEAELMRVGSSVAYLDIS
jgi:hypothetical protein